MRLHNAGEVRSKIALFIHVICTECAFASPDDQRVPGNSDPSSTESLSNGSDWNGLLGLPANGNNTSDSLSQDDDLGQCLFHSGCRQCCSHTTVDVVNETSFYNLL